MWFESAVAHHLKSLLARPDRLLPSHNVLYIGDRGVRTPELAALDRDFVLIETHPAVAMDTAPGTRVQLSVWRRLTRVS
jgi:hypothetical protein